MAITLFILFVAFVLGLSIYLGRQTKSASGYFAAGGTVPWEVNGIAFAGDYLSAASFLGICGMIATVGYDGFLYSIGYLAGWVVALFIVAEPMKRLGKYTFTDAVDSKYNSRGIQLAAAISTLIVSIFYLIPQMVGAGVLVTPLLGLPHAVGVIMVGAIVIFIVATAGMKSTTWVQFIKGALLIVCSFALVVMVCIRGFSTTPDQSGNNEFYQYKTLKATERDGKLIPDDDHYVTAVEESKSATYYKLDKERKLGRNADGTWSYTMLRGRVVPLDGFETRLLTFMLDKNLESDEINGLRFIKRNGDLFAVTSFWWKREGNDAEGRVILKEMASVTVRADGTRMINGLPAQPNQQLQVGSLTKIAGKEGKEAETGAVGPFKFLAILSDPETKVQRWKQEMSFTSGGYSVTLFGPTITDGNRIMRPGLKYKVEGTWFERLDFISLMLALFLGTAALPHILIRYYTVPSPAAARKSTILAIAAIGFFYILTLYMGLGAMINSVIDPTDNNMSGPLLARSFNPILFAIISAIAFATVLGTVSGLIVAASGAVAHDLLDRFYALQLNDRQKVVIGKAAAFTVGLVAIILGIVFKGMNVSFLVGLAFAVAASANLPAIVMLLFWKRTTAKGIVASIIVGILSAVGLILFSPEMYVQYGLSPKQAPVPFNNPGIISIPLSFITLVVVSLVTSKDGTAEAQARKTST